MNPTCSLFLALLGAGAAVSCTDGDGRPPKPTHAAEPGDEVHSAPDDPTPEAKAKPDTDAGDPCVRACIDERIMQAVSASAIEARCKAECSVGKAPPR